MAHRLLTIMLGILPQDAFAAYCMQQFCEENFNFWSEAEALLRKYPAVQRERRGTVEGKSDSAGNESTVNLAGDSRECVPHDTYLISHPLSLWLSRFGVFSLKTPSCGQFRCVPCMGNRLGLEPTALIGVGFAMVVVVFGSESGAIFYDWV